MDFWFCPFSNTNWWFSHLLVPPSVLSRVDCLTSGVVFQGCALGGVLERWEQIQSLSISQISSSVGRLWFPPLSLTDKSQDSAPLCCCQPESTAARTEPRPESAKVVHLLDCVSICVILCGNATSCRATTEIFTQTELVLFKFD